MEEYQLTPPVVVEAVMTLLDYMQEHQLTEIRYRGMHFELSRIAEIRKPNERR